MTAELDRVVQALPIENEDGDWVFYPFDSSVAGSPSLGEIATGPGASRRSGLGAKGFNR
jgi:hypothetical protein